MDDPIDIKTDKPEAPSPQSIFETISRGIGSNTSSIKSLMKIQEAQAERTLQLAEQFARMTTVLTKAELVIETHKQQADAVKGRVTFLTWLTLALVVTQCIGWFI